MLWLPFVCARKPHHQWRSSRGLRTLDYGLQWFTMARLLFLGGRGVWVMRHAYSYTLRFIVFALHFRSILYFICFVHVRSTYDFSAISLFAFYGPPRTGDRNIDGDIGPGQMRVCGCHIARLSWGFKQIYFQLNKLITWPTTWQNLAVRPPLQSPANASSEGVCVLALGSGLIYAANSIYLRYT